MKTLTAIATIAPLISTLLLSPSNATSAETQKTDANLKIQVENLMNRINELESKQNIVGPITEKEAVISGNPLNLKISGAVNRAVQWHDSGSQSNTVHVDGINENFTHFHLEATGKLSEDKTVGAIIEPGVISNAPELIDVHDANDTTTSFGFNVIEAFLESKSLGKVTLGFGYLAATRVMYDTDQSGTTVIGAGTSVVQNGAGTIFFDKRSGANGARGSTTGGTSLSVLSVFNSFPEWGDRIQYDSPTFWGTKLAASHTYRGRNDVWDIALKHASKIGATNVAAQAGYFNNGSNTGGGTTANVPAKYQQWSGSASVLFSGVSFMLAGAHRDWDLKDAPNGKIYYGKLGYQHQIVEAGMTAFAVDYGYFKNLVLNRGTAGVAETNIRNKFVGTTFGAFLVQHLDRIATELYLSARLYKLDGENSSSARYKDITVVTSGLRVKF